MTDQSLDAFEAWARKECKANGTDLRRNQNGYIWSEWARAYKSWQAATAAERERCALVCEEIAADYHKQAREGDTTGASDWREMASEECAGAIRQGGEA